MLLGTSDVLRGCAAWVVNLVEEGTTMLLVVVATEVGACVDEGTWVVEACVDDVCVVVTATDVVTCLVEVV